jgi:hypothetical protein
MNKCKCGEELGEHDARFVIDPMSQEFVCPECWAAAKKKRKSELNKCCRCHKVLDGVNFIDHRSCNTYDNDGKYNWNLVCTDCEPYTKMGERH